MRKLAWAAFGFSAAIFFAHDLLGENALPWAALAALLLLPLARLGKGLNRRRAVLLLCGLAVGFGWYALTVRRTLTPIRALDPEREYTVSARVTDYPAAYDRSTGLTLRITELGFSRLAARVYDYDDCCGSLLPGDEITVTLKLRPATERYGEETDSYISRGIGLLGAVCAPPHVTGTWKWSALYLPKQLSHRLLELEEAVFPKDVSAFAKALMLGDTRGLYDEQLDIALRDAGIMHVVAVSGLHLTYLLAAVRLLLGKRRSGALLSLPFIAVFTVMAGCTPSILRASFMAMVLLLALVLRRENDPATSLLTALAVLLLVQPFSAGSVSLQLSFASMAGIFLLSGRVYRWLKRKWMPTGGKPGRVLKYVLTTISATVGSMVFTIPLGAVHFGTVALAAPVTNLLVLWAVSPAFLGCYAASVAAQLSLPLGKVLAWVVAWPLRYVLLTAHVMARLHGLLYSTENPLVVLWLVFVYVLLGGSWYFARKGKEALRLCLPVLCCGLGLLAVVMGTQIRSDGMNLVTAEDVGQGQCLFFRVGTECVMVDCGGNHSSRNAGDIAARALLAEGRHTLDVLVLTHPHEDHVNGAERLLLQTKVRLLVLPAAADAQTDPIRSIVAVAQRRGTEVLRLEEDTRIDLEHLRLDLFVTLGREHEDGCLMLRVSSGDFDTLITGDVTTGVERQLAEDYALEDTELFIAGHHGSKYASGDVLLRELGAACAIISCGDNNYGHPAEEALARLARHGLEIYRTDELGAVTVQMEVN